jgi:hypothetical protein
VERLFLFRYPHRLAEYIDMPNQCIQTGFQQIHSKKIRAARHPKPPIIWHRNLRKNAGRMPTGDPPIKRNEYTNAEIIASIPVKSCGNVPVPMAEPGKPVPPYGSVIQSDLFDAHPSVTILPVTSELRDAPAPLFRILVNPTELSGLA